MVWIPEQDLDASAQDAGTWSEIVVFEPRIGKQRSHEECQAYLALCVCHKGPNAL